MALIPFCSQGVFGDDAVTFDAATGDNGCWVGWGWGGFAGIIGVGGTSDCWGWGLGGFGGIMGLGGTSDCWGCSLGEFKPGIKVNVSGRERLKTGILSVKLLGNSCTICRQSAWATNQ
ncbi:MAG: hypothetical protein Fur0025_30690 [Oscillatoriaceae cyanobacterium]